MDNNSPIFVTQPFLPPLEEFHPYLEKIWKNKWLTNAGPFHQELEDALADHLGVKHISLFANGTIALVTALQTLRITGEVITTPYSFVATAHSLLWNSLTPVFVDIDPITCNINPDRIEEAITSKTAAIMPVHCYGNPCEVEKIQHIADVYGIKVIYDAAHAFGVTHEGGSLLNHGDLSVLSFHATKVYNTFEGGAIVCPNKKIKQRIDFLKNFGFSDEITVEAPGINGKMNEIQAAFGLLQLKYIDKVIDMRQEIDGSYRQRLSSTPGIVVPPMNPSGDNNFSYFPIFVKPDYPLTRNELYEKLKSNNIYSRRYFYPLISDLPMYRGLDSARPANLPIASEIANQIICLPIYADMAISDVDRVVNVIKSI